VGHLSGPSSSGSAAKAENTSQSADVNAMRRRKDFILNLLQDSEGELNFLSLGARKAGWGSPYCHLMWIIDNHGLGLQGPLQQGVFRTLPAIFSCALIYWVHPAVPVLYLFSTPSAPPVLGDETLEPLLHPARVTFFIFKLDFGAACFA
jgi:hypothetical protein